MKRRRFLHDLSFITGGLLTAYHLPGDFFTAKSSIKGKVVADGKGIRGVVVSDGYSVVLTDAKGKYEIDAHPDATNVFISTPAGFDFNNEKGIARHYYRLEGRKRKQAFNFELSKLDRDDHEHEFIIWADPQVKNKSDVDKLMAQTVPDVKKWVEAKDKSALLHGITVGDIVWDELQLFNDYNVAVEQMGIPFFQCLGNHDMDYRQGGDESSDQSFQRMYGPTHYSFNRGKVHYVVMDDVRYLGKEREYDGYFQQNQLDWLRKDLSFVPKDQLVILCVHIPVHNGVKNNSALYDILEDRKVHIMSGHTHYHRNVIKGNIYEHNHGTVCGAWWTGPICGDGTPCGYGVYKVKGNELSWHYQATGESADHQLKVFVQDNKAENEVLVNIWNHDPAWKTTYWIDGVEAGALQQTEAFDPLAYATLLGPELPKPRGFAEPRKTEHMFTAKLPAGAKEIRVVATDRFGKKFEVRQKV